jgi:hypothetical protein
MHALAKDRLGAMAQRVEFVTRDFRSPGWYSGLPRYGTVITLQAVHELRHKRRATVLYGQIRSVLSPGGALLVCDHFSGLGGMSDTALYMNVEEQESALRSAGFDEISCLLNKGGMVLFRAHPA